jgi:P-type conjugative transfer protein TrbJ
MPSAFSRTARIAIAALMSVSPLSTVEAGTSFVGATEWTQILNNGELVGLVGQSAEQIQNQVTQITQLAEQIQNQLRIYENMLQNTLTLPSHVWGQVGKRSDAVAEPRPAGPIDRLLHGQCR